MCICMLVHQVHPRKHRQFRQAPNYLVLPVHHVWLQHFQGVRDERAVAALSVVDALLGALLMKSRA
jgi:hypothetical protein